MSLAPGTRLGPYEVLAALGSGGMGGVVDGAGYHIRLPRARTGRLDWRNRE